MEHPNQLRVLTLNVGGFYRSQMTARIEYLSKTIERLRPDVLCLQEVHTGKLQQRLTDRLAETMPNAIFDRDLSGPKYGLMVFLGPAISVDQALPHSTFALEGTLARLLHADPFAHGMQLIELSQPRLLLANVHLPPNRSGDWSSPTKGTERVTASFSALQEILNECRARNSDPMLLCGDLNAPPTFEPLVKFLKSNELEDAFRRKRTPTYHREYLKRGRIPHRVDYILLDRQAYLRYSGKERLVARILFASRLKLGSKLRYLSDHKGLDLNFRFRHSR
jgi:exonuclease III